MLVKLTDALRTCPNTEFKEGRLRFCGLPPIRKKNGWGTELLYLVETGQAQFLDSFLDTNRDGFTVCCA
jgi:hypothetical protein